MFTIKASGSKINASEDRECDNNEGTALIFLGHLRSRLNHTIIGEPLALLKYIFLKDMKSV